MNIAGGEKVESCKYGYWARWCYDGADVIVLFWDDGTFMRLEDEGQEKAHRGLIEDIKGLRWCEYEEKGQEDIQEEYEGLEGVEVTYEVNLDMLDYIS